jgi:hypothetical protein
MSAKKPQIVSCGPVASMLWYDLYWAYVIEYLSEEMKFILKNYHSFPFFISLVESGILPGMDHHAYMVVRKRKEHGYPAFPRAW